MDGAREDQESWVRRAVIALLVVVGVVTTAYAVVATRPDPSEQAQDAGGPAEVVTDFVPSDGASQGPLRLGRVLVAGRHGDPVDRPEHTAESFAAAYDAGVDYLETSVVMTKDDQLLVRGDNDLSASTDVADHPEFADRRTTKDVDGVTTTGWFSEDFTLDELRTLHATEPDPALRAESASHDGEFGLISFDDLLTQLGDLNAAQGKKVGLFVQPLRASYFRHLGLPMEPAIGKELRKARLVNEPERVTVESSDLAVLARLEGNVGDNVLSGFVVDAASADQLQPDALAALPSTIDVVVVEAGAFAAAGGADLPQHVHDAGFALAVYPISFENALLSPYFQRGDDPAGAGDLAGLLAGLQKLGVDVVLAASPTEVVDTLATLAQGASASPSDGPS